MTAKTVSAERKRIEKAMEDEIESLLSVRRKAGDNGRPARPVALGRKILGARRNDRKTMVWRPGAYRCERLVA